MKPILTLLFVAASLMAAPLPNPSTLIDQTAAQAQTQRVAQRYSDAPVPGSQMAADRPREEEYRRIQEDLQKWFPSHTWAAAEKRIIKFQH